MVNASIDWEKKGLAGNWIATIARLIREATRAALGAGDGEGVDELTTILAVRKASATAVMPRAPDARWIVSSGR